MSHPVPPVEEGEMYCVEIEVLGDEGDGIGRVDGYTIFVPGTVPGEEVLVRVDRVKERFAFAEPVG